MDQIITLECTKCMKTLDVIRLPDDPQSAVKVQIQCPECNAGDFDSPHYFDAAGNEVIWQEPEAR